MSSPEVVRLGRRVDAQDESLRAIADTVVEVREVQDLHTETLTAIQREQEQQRGLLNEILRRLDAR